MSALKYSLLAKFVSVVFAALVIYVLFGTIRNVLIEYKGIRKKIRESGSGNIIGYAALTDEWQDEDAWRPIYDDTVFGSSHECAFRITGHGLKGQHFRITRGKDRFFIERLCMKSDLLMVNEHDVRRKERIRSVCKVYAGDAEILITLMDGWNGRD